ncbi:tetratricopeptide repeat protein [Pricia sp. S334]|uniref:Oxygen sensor histidine kinase NreB n=1 Tax=Pricia mediterranea TaxID=3076079 RepID=A0ABU3LBK9_9FLAO|nr:tetratricopeptide repeat protein [Pricia sp. S334]MDT7830671.1 tetratricopeptide repeat protein [Pricia sp. S334]
MLSFHLINQNIVRLLCFGLLFSWSCGSEQRKVVTKSSELDSLYTLIQEGRNTELSVEERKKRLSEVFSEISSLENDSTKTKVFSQLSLAYLKLNDSLNFRKTNSKTRNMAGKIGDSTSLAEAHWDLAEFYKTIAVEDSAYFHYLTAHKIYTDIGKINESATMLNNMAIAQSDVKDYTGSEISTINAIELLKPLQNYRQLFNSYNNLGSVTTELNDYDRAIDYFNTALEYQEKIAGKHDLELITLNNIGYVYLTKGEYDKALPYFEKVLSENGLRERMPKFYARTLNNHAYSKMKSGNTEKVRSEFLEALKIRDSLNDITGLSLSHHDLAEYHLSQSDTTVAISHAKNALRYAEFVDNNERILRTLKLLSRLDPENSFSYNRRYIVLNDSLQEEERQTRNKFARIRFETDEYIAENQMLESEKQLWAGIAIAIFLLGASAVVIFNQRSKNQKLRFQQEQQAANQEIFNLMLAQKQKEEEGRKSEQKRISEELHDGVLGSMMGARMVLAGLNKKNGSEAEAQRQKALDALQGAEKEVREISHALSHTAYQKINNFILSLQDLLKSVEQRANINCRLVYNKEWEWDSLNGEIKINVYRMIQETLQNCVKHAQCNNVTVTFATRHSDLQVTIADDGKGFRKTHKKKGIGMRNIASRIEKLNGNWRVDSTIGKGTTVSLYIPIPKIEHPESSSVRRSPPIQES